MKTVDRFIYSGAQINNKNLIQDEIRLRTEVGNRSVFENKKTTAK
jgi:hypothetical protein